MPPHFKYEVFISYAHLDNVPLFSGRDGWVAQFTELLDTLLSQYLGSKARIWRDNLMRGDDIVPDTLRRQFPDIAVMVSILSPPFLKSEWCLWEVKEFCDKAMATGGFRIQNKSRIYKILKTPIRNGRPPAVFDDLVGYEFFFKPKNQNETPRPFGVEHGQEATKNFLDRVGDVAFDIANLLEIIRANAEAENAQAKGAGEENAAGDNEAGPPDPQDEETPPEGTTPLVVYLAEPTPDLLLEHANVRRDLLERQYKVLPEYPLPTKADEFMASVRADLNQSNLSIHLVGKEYGEGPEGDILSRSHAHLQNIIAAEHGRGSNFPRLIWMPKGNKPSSQEQEKFIGEVLDSGTSPTTDLLQTTLENFKTVIYDTINNINERAAQGDDEMPAQGAARSIYIVCANQDTEAIGAVEDYLLSMGYDTYLPQMNGDEAAVRRDHEEKLRKCDAVLVYWDTAPKLWLLTKLDDLRKIQGYGRRRPLLSKSVFIAGEKTAEKERFRARDGLVIRSFGELNPAELDRALQPFIREIEQAEEEDVREN